LLLLNYKILGSWPLAITAYNHGVGGIRKATAAVGTSDITTLINKYDGPNFGFASKNFYTGFLGLLATLKNAEKIFPNVPYVAPLVFRNISVGGKSVEEVRTKNKLTNSVIASYNPDITWGFLRRGGVFPKRYMLKVPASKQDAPISLVSYDD
jgi:membrane-bound lytic murein transglycosylase D